MGQAFSALLEDGLVTATKKNVYKAAAGSIAVWEQVVHCDTTVAGFTLTLPPVAEAVGRSYAIFLDAGATNAVTLEDFGSLDSKDWTDKTLNAASDNITVKSDGEKWVLTNEIA